MSFSWILLLILTLGGAVSAQESVKSLSYGYVSSNTAENLTLEQAINGMKSTEETELWLKAINLSCVVKSRIRAYKALGSWDDGAEYSVMLRLESDEATLRYLLSRMGRDAQQKYVVYFQPHPAGEVHLYVLRLPRRSGNLFALSKRLDTAGLPSRTVVPLGRTTAIYIIDLYGDLRDRIFAAARQLGARVSSRPGNAGLFGDDDRQKAKLTFEKEINSYEARYPNLPPTCDVQKARRKTRNAR